VLAAALAGPGCFETMPFVARPAAPAPLPPAPALPPAPPAVVPDQVTDANAREMAEALARELEYDGLQQAMTPPVTHEDKKPQ
jgi:hypothetical protein